MAMATHIDSARLHQVVMDKLDLTMDELQHMLKMREVPGRPCDAPKRKPEE
jgi:hypothetical protein